MLDDFKTELARLGSAQRYREGNLYAPEAGSGHHNQHVRLQFFGNGGPQDDSGDYAKGGLNHGSVNQIEDIGLPSNPAGSNSASNPQVIDNVSLRGDQV